MCGIYWVVYVVNVIYKSSWLYVKLFSVFSLELVGNIFYQLDYVLFDFLVLVDVDGESYFGLVVFSVDGNIFQSKIEVCSLIGNLI